MDVFNVRFGVPYLFWTTTCLFGPDSLVNTYYGRPGRFSHLWFDVWEIMRLAHLLRNNGENLHPLGLQTFPRSHLFIIV